MQLVVAGDDTAFEVLFERHVAAALAYALETLCSLEDAEEAVRHSFAAAHAYLATRGRDVEFEPWLHTILGNRCLSLLQARPAGPGAPANGGTVVDLEEWRRRRSLLGVPLPVTASAGLRDSVMAASGIGTSAATAGAPLLGGALTKVAVVAVLATSAGGGGPAVPDPGWSALGHGGGPPPAAVERSVDEAARSHLGMASSAEPARRPRLGVPDPAVRKPDRPARTIREEPVSRALPAAESPPAQVPSEAAPVADGPLPSTAPATTVQSVVQRVGRSLEPPGEPVAVGLLETAELPATVDLPEILPEIGDDPGVAPVELPVDPQALLSQGAGALPK